MRTFSSRLTRKGSPSQANVDMRKASAVLEDMYYNFIKPLKTLRLPAEEKSGLKWLPRTPAMAAGLTEHVWTVKDSAWLGSENNTQQGDNLFAIFLYSLVEAFRCLQVFSTVYFLCIARDITNDNPAAPEELIKKIHAAYLGDQSGTANSHNP